MPLMSLMRLLMPLKFLMLLMCLMPQSLLASLLSDNGTNVFDASDFPNVPYDPEMSDFPDDQ